MVSLSLIVSVILVAVIAQLLKLWNYVSTVNKIPGPPVRWKFWKRGTIDQLVEWSKQYGPIMRIWNGPFLMIVITDPDEAKKILYDQKNYSIASRFILRNILGEGLVVSDGAMWEKHRRLLNPGFAMSVLRKMMPMMVEVGQELINKFNIIPPNEPVDMKKSLLQAALDIIGNAAFGTKFNSLTDHESELSKTLDSKALLKTPLWFMMFASKWKFVSSIPISYNKINWDRTDKVQSILKKVIDDRQEERFQESNERDLLGLMLNAKEGGEELSEKEIQDEASTFLFAGHDTTSALLSWFFYELCLHPEVLSKLQKEVDDVLKGSPPTQENLSNMKYLTMVINETFRTHSPVPSLRRVARVDAVCMGYTIPKGTTLNVSSYPAQMSEKYWKNPNDFNPSRWENLSEEETKAFYPFSAGPRVCIGRNFALLEAKTLASMVVQNYDFKLVENQTIVPVTMVTMFPSTLNMYITKRKK